MLNVLSVLNVLNEGGRTRTLHEELNLREMVVEIRDVGFAQALIDLGIMLVSEERRGALHTFHIQPTQ